jgi:hypothetical protein
VTLGNLSYWPILIAAIFSFLFGAVWYGSLSRQWMEAAGLTAVDMEQRKAGMGPVPWPYILTFIALLVMAWMFAGVLLHLARGGMQVGVRAGLIAGFFMWFGFVMTTMVVNHAFQGARRTLTAIDGGHWLGVLLIQGAILGWWGVL